MNECLLKYILIFAILFGIVLRFVSFNYYYPEHGAIIQLAMAKSNRETGKLNLEYGPIFDSKIIISTPSNHFPPLYSYIIALFLNPVNITKFKSFSFILAILSIIVIYILTDFCLGRLAAFFTTALWSTGGVFIDNSAKCLSENLQVILITIFIALIYGSKKLLNIYLNSKAIARESPEFLRGIEH